MDADFVRFATDDPEGDVSPTLLTECPAPWMAFEKEIGRAPPLIRLHNEILTFCDYIRPTDQEIDSRKRLVEELRVFITSIWPGCSVHVFGSQMTDILTPTSDLDIAVLDVTCDCEESTDLLHILAAKFRDSGTVTYVEAIVNAKIPIIKLDHAETKISVDICINNDSGLRTGELIREYVETYPPLKPLTIVLKTFLAQRRLNETYNGGVGSFVLSCLVVSFLQMKQRISLACKSVPNWNLGSLLLEFLQLYGIQFNSVITGISIVNGGEYFPKMKRKAGEVFSSR